MRRAAYPPDRRGQILEAALSCFLAKGYSASSIADIRARSGATTGSIYHFFTGKAAIAEALLEDAANGWAAAGDQPVDASSTAEQIIKGSVHNLVTWGLSHPTQLRFMMEMRHLAAMDPDLVGVRKLIARDLLGGTSHYARLAAQGSVRNLPWSIAQALMLGAAVTYLNANPTPAPGEADRIATLFADAAWQAVRA